MFKRFFQFSQLVFTIFIVTTFIGKSSNAGRWLCCFCDDDEEVLVKAKKEIAKRKEQENRAEWKKECERINNNFFTDELIPFTDEPIPTYEKFLQDKEQKKQEWEKETKERMRVKREEKRKAAERLFNAKEGTWDGMDYNFWKSVNKRARSSRDYPPDDIMDHLRTFSQEKARKKQEADNKNNNSNSAKDEKKPLLDWREQREKEEAPLMSGNACMVDSYRCHGSNEALKRWLNENKAYHSSPPSRYLDIIYSVNVSPLTPTYYLTHEEALKLANHIRNREFFKFDIHIFTPSIKKY